MIDQREIMHLKVKPHPSIFVQNTKVEYKLTSDNQEVWIENSHVGPKWKLHSKNIITGVPENDWELNIADGVCIDVVPIGESDSVARPYGFNDMFRGDITDAGTAFLGNPAPQWFNDRKLNAEEIEGKQDLQAARIFPVCTSTEELGLVLRFMTSEPTLAEGKEIYLKAKKLSADEISTYANLRRLTAQRKEIQK